MARGLISGKPEGLYAKGARPTGQRHMRLLGGRIGVPVRGSGAATARRTGSSRPRGAVWPGGPALASRREPLDRDQTGVDKRGRRATSATKAHGGGPPEPRRNHAGGLYRAGREVGEVEGATESLTRGLGSLEGGRRMVNDVRGGRCGLGS